MKGLLWGLVLTALASPAYAGHGTIEETDDVIIVEYAGDASDKAPPPSATAPTPSVQSGRNASLVPPRGYQAAPQVNSNNGEQPPERRPRMGARRGRYRSGNPAGGENQE